ncbi:hypothetical protein ACFQX9_27470 [Bradyrhizobium sp. GCM10028915]|uniref:hypothetical protein n=1 Tax=Bradyrhizobium sp. GCM10028915 TaxID=3273385 RepID=UPI00360F4C64
MADDFGTPVTIPGPAPIPADKLPNPRLGERLGPKRAPAWSRSKRIFGMRLVRRTRPAQPVEDSDVGCRAQSPEVRSLEAHAHLPSCGAPNLRACIGVETRFFERTEVVSEAVRGYVLVRACHGSCYRASNRGYKDADVSGQTTFRRGTDFEGRFTPSFRSLIAYFARRRKSGGYGAIQKQNANQQPWDSQVNLSYLIGLDWRIPRDIQDLQARKKGMQNLKKAIKEGELGVIFGSSAEIRPEIVRTEERLAQLKARIDSFQVLETYRETAAEVSALKIRMNAIALDLSLADETIAHLNEAISDEEPPAYASVERLYSEAGVVADGLAATFR